MRQQENQVNNITFLIVDAQSQIRSLIKQMLKFCNYKNFKVIDDGRQALNIIQTEKIDVIISGWNVPTIRGIELLKRVKKNPNFFLTPFILVSNENSMNKVIYALEEGVEGYLVVPFTEADFTKILTKALEEKSNPDLYKLKVVQMIRHKFNHNYPAAIKIGYNLLQQRTNIRVSHLTGECLYKINEFEKAGEMVKKALNDQKSSKLLNLLGKICMASGKSDEAITYFKAASKENPENPEGNISLAELYFRQGSVQKAHAMIDVIKSASPSPLDLVQIGKLYLEYAPEKAGTIFDEVSPIGETVEYFQSYANILGKENRNRESIAILEKCIESQPDSFTSYYNIGVMHLKSGNHKKAKAAFQKTLKLKPHYGLAEKYLSMIEEKIQ
ncbi:MAG: tetratricopeptide repeat protein [Proteobacteria bacterium]|nr:tetratricopeptide repeat protein [Pseudomonadota bacterium]